MSKWGCILEISFLACLINTFPVGGWLVGGGNCDYKSTSVAIAIASLTELGNSYSTVCGYLAIGALLKSVHNKG
jgi:hypothetical protein